MPKITPTSHVTLHFSLKLDTGEEIDSTYGKDAASFTMQDGSLLPGFEQVLIGLKAGDKQTFLVKAEQGFGLPNPQNIQKIGREYFKEVALDVGLVLLFKDAAGADLPGIAQSYDNQEVMIDFNHPLSGKDILFDVDIIEVV